MYYNKKLSSELALSFYKLLQKNGIWSCLLLGPDRRSYAGVKFRADKEDEAKVVKLWKSAKRSLKKTK